MGYLDLLSSGLSTLLDKISDTSKQQKWWKQSVVNTNQEINNEPRKCSPLILFHKAWNCLHTSCSIMPLNWTPEAYNKELHFANHTNENVHTCQRKGPSLTSFVFRVGDESFLHGFWGNNLVLVLWGGHGVLDLSDRFKGLHNRDVAKLLGNGKWCLPILYNNKGF